MDSNLDRRREHQQGRLRYQQSSPTLQQASVRQPEPPRPHLVSQRQWEDIPLPYRPREWRDPLEAPSHEAVPEPLFAWRLRRGTDEARQRVDATGQRRQPRAPRNLFNRREFEEQGRDVDSSLLYPQMSPYDDQHSSLSAPDELGYFPRSVSQPNTPSLWPLTQEDETNEPRFTMMPRSPTYPPLSRRRVRSAVNVADTTFTDEEEFSLFVQATAGIMPEQTYTQSGVATTSSRNLQGLHNDASHLHCPDSEQLVSALQDTPTTMRALQQLAQLPQGSLGSGQRGVDLPQTSTPIRRANEAAMAGVDLWIEPPSPTFDEDDVSLIDDELPDYASSQQQAHAAQRAEAARRARELQLRWRQSQGK